MRSVLALCFLSVLQSCGGPTSDDQLISYIRNDLHIPPEHEPKAIFVVTEDGCTACDRAFSDLLRVHTSSPSCLFVVRAEGRSIDLNGFLEETNSVRFDDGGFQELGILDGSGVILLENERIDTIIPLRVEEIQEQLTYIRGVIDSIAPEIPASDHIPR